MIRKDILNIAKLNFMYFHEYEYDFVGKIDKLWKIDAFYSPGMESKTYDVTYKNTKRDNKDFFDFKATELILKESYGFNEDVIYRNDDGSFTYIVRKINSKEILLNYHINSKWNTFKCRDDNTDTEGSYAFEYFSRIFSYSIINYTGIVLHGVLMEHNNKGIIISAPSGTGKTTHARMWRDKERALIINGDRALCRKIDGKWTGFGMPWCGTSGEYINRDIQIDAIVVLEQAKENSVEKLEILQAFNHMIPNITAPTWEKNLLNKAMDYLEDMVNEIPVYKLKCTPDMEAVEVLKKEIDKL